jgi:hypothetical protein
MRRIPFPSSSNTRTNVQILLLVYLAIILFPLSSAQVEMRLDTVRNGDSGDIMVLGKVARKFVNKWFRRKLKIPPKSSLSLNTQVSRPNIFPNVLNLDEGIVVDGVLEWPMWSKNEIFMTKGNNSMTSNATLS